MPITSLFLGAGASRAIGFPTTSEFMENLAQELKGRNRFLEEILAHNRELPNVKDIEHVLEILDALITCDSNPYAHSFFDRVKPLVRTTKREIRWDEYLYACKELKDHIIAELYRQYEFDPSKVELLYETYDKLLGVLASGNEHNQLDIFTTNYDRSIEEYSIAARSNQIELIDGFPYDGRREGRFWKPEDYKRKPNPHTLQLRLFKLHGSLDWRETYSGEFESVKPEERCLGTRRYRRNTLIYPTQKGLEVEEPFATLHRYFKEISSNCRLLTVVGFSFRDQPINGILLDSLRENNKQKLVVVSPNAKKHITTNLLAEVENVKEKAAFERRAIPVEAKFGEKETLEKIFANVSSAGSKEASD